MPRGGFAYARLPMLPEKKKVDLFWLRLLTTVHILYILYIYSKQIEEVTA